MSSKSISAADAGGAARRARGKDEDEHLRPESGRLERVGDPQRISEPQLGCPGLDQFEQLARVLGSGEVDANARIVTDGTGR